MQLRIKALLILNIHGVHFRMIDYDVHYALQSLEECRAYYIQK